MRVTIAVAKESFDKERLDHNEDKQRALEEIELFN